MHILYDSAVKQLSLKFEILNNEFKVLYARSPIHHIEGRIKSPESIAAKLLKKGFPPTLETARENINDIAGVRVVCSYIEDVYYVVEILERQKDIETIKWQDYRGGKGAYILRSGRNGTIVIAVSAIRTGPRRTTVSVDDGAAQFG